MKNGFEHLHIEKQLAHNPKDAVAHAYNHAEYLKQRIEIMQWWADYVGGQKRDEVNCRWYKLRFYNGK